MNERIQALADECQSRYSEHRIDLEKFANLIVAECLEIVANADMTELEGPDPDDVLYVACKQIRHHFGVSDGSQI